jgi:phosphoribosylanthranilate isomerase
MKQVKIKVCGMTDPENVREIMHHKPDYIGLIFYDKSPRSIENGEARGKFSVSGETKKVGVFVNENFDRIINFTKEFELDLVQLHGSETPGDCQRIRSTGLGVIKVFGIDNNFDFNKCRDYIPFADLFLFDTRSEKHGGTGKKFDWGKLKDYQFNTPFLLSGGISIRDVQDLKNMDHDCLAGFDINSQFETRPGYKDSELVGRFIQEMRKNEN